MGEGLLVPCLVKMIIMEAEREADMAAAAAGPKLSILFFQALKNIFADYTVTGSSHH